MFRTFLLTTRDLREEGRVYKINGGVNKHGKIRKDSRFKGAGIGISVGVFAISTRGPPAHRTIEQGGSFDNG